MMIPRSVRKLLSLCARIDSSEARSNSPRLTSTPGRRCLVRLRFADEIARLQRAQLLERARDEGLSLLEPLRDLDGQLSEQSGRDGLEDRLPALDEEDALLLLGRRRGGRGARLTLFRVAHDE